MRKSDYLLLLRLAQLAIENKIKWLKTQKEYNYALFNAGQMKAYHDVLQMLELDSRDLKSKIQKEEGA
ncbi:hypothetical protein [Paenibacillus illinoisensis]|uniref:hypothetical protein n=1 Tax=Paenibacillus illinoisensis TaxID=59845 RepID=UPI00301CBC8D